MHLATLVGLCERGNSHIRSAYQFLFIGQHEVAEIEEVIKASFSLCHFLLEGWRGRREGGSYHLSVGKKYMYLSHSLLCSHPVDTSAISDCIHQLVNALTTCPYMY